MPPGRAKWVAALAAGAAGWFAAGAWVASTDDQRELARESRTLLPGQRPVRLRADGPGALPQGGAEVAGSPEHGTGADPVQEPAAAASNDSGRSEIDGAPILDPAGVAVQRLRRGRLRNLMALSLDMTTAHFPATSELTQEQRTRATRRVEAADPGGAKAGAGNAPWDDVPFDAFGVVAGAEVVSLPGSDRFVPASVETTVAWHRSRMGGGDRAATTLEKIRDVARDYELRRHALTAELIACAMATPEGAPADPYIAFRIDRERGVALLRSEDVSEMDELVERYRQVLPAFWASNRRFAEALR